MRNLHSNLCNDLVQNQCLNVWNLFLLFLFLLLCAVQWTHPLDSLNQRCSIVVLGVDPVDIGSVGHGLGHVSEAASWGGPVKQQVCREVCQIGEDWWRLGPLHPNWGLGFRLCDKHSECQGSWVIRMYGQRPTTISCYSVHFRRNITHDIITSSSHLTKFTWTRVF